MQNAMWVAFAALELGGFGAGKNGLKVSATVGADWRAWEETTIFFGYRYFSVDYRPTVNGLAFAYDIDQHSPVLGVSFGSESKANVALAQSLLCPLCCHSITG